MTEHDARRRNNTTKTPEQALLYLARRYIWWQTPVEAVCFPNRVIAQAMHFGLLPDIRMMIRSLGPDRLRQTLADAPPGVLSRCDWYFWHQMLGQPGTDGLVEVPPLPQRPIE